MASYVESTLGSGEKIEYQAKTSFWTQLPLIVLGLFGLPLYGLGLLFWLIAYIRYSTTELAVTDKKVVAKFGFISRDVIEMLLPKVESIQVTQSILGRMCNYGSIVISGAGNPKTPIPGIDNPMEFRKKFMEIQATSTGR